MRTRKLFVAMLAVAAFSVRATAVVNLELRPEFQQVSIGSGILFLVGHNPCAALTENDVKETMAAYDKALSTIKQGLDSDSLKSRLTGKRVSPVFRKA